MALSILLRPYGYIRSGNSITAISADAFGSKVLISKNSHGLTDNYVIYFISPVEQYNGWKKVDVENSGQFTLKNLDDTFVSFIRALTTDISFYITTEIAGFTDPHTWNCVHLPIVYKLSNTLWPTNSADTVRTMSSVTDSNGYCNITASGDIKATGSAAALEYVKITGATDSSLNKVWQIITYSSDTSFVLNIPYSAANDTALTGASIQYYYNNYNVRVRVYGGLPNSHYFESQRPYVQISELKITPDSDNLVSFSVADILKSQITTDNNTLLGTLPNNINNWTGFYIEYAEAYDVATGGVLVNTVGSYTSDKANFEGYAVNAMLPFKNIYSGAMSEYLMVNSSSKFLTLFDQPVIFPGKYFDISFISEFFQTFTNQLLSAFTNNSTGTAWTLSATPSVTLADGASSQLLSVLFTQGFKSGVTYRVAVNINYTGASTTVLTASIESAANTNVNFVQTFLNTGANVFTVDLTAAGDYSYLVFRVVDTAGGGGGDYGLNNYWIYPVDDTSYAKIELRQGGISSFVDAFDEGVYRVKLEEPNCNASSMEVSLYKGLISPTPLPTEWTETAAWTSKGFNTLTWVDASSPYTQPESYFDLVDLIAGDKVIIDIGVALSGTFSGTVTVTGVISDGPSTVISESPNPSISLTTGQSGTLSFNRAVNTTTTNGRFNISIGLSGTGSVTLVLTIPETYIVVSDQISETKTIKIDCNCAMPQSEGGMNLSWLNCLGGYDHWFFTTEQEKQINVLETATTDDNIFPNWHNSYGEFARGITRQTYRKAKNRIKLTSQLCTLDQLKGLQYIRTSPVVTITNSIYDTRVIIIDDESFTLYTQGDKQYFISFYAEFTDLIPSQRR